MSEKTMASRRGRVRAEYDRWYEDLRAALEPREGAAVTREVLEEVWRRAEGLLERMPDPGARAPTMRAFSTAGLLYIAVYLALRERGYDAARSWEVCEAATRSRFGRFSWLERWASSAGMFSLPMRWMTRSLAKRPAGGWRLRYVPGEEGGFEFGVDYEACAIRTLALASGAEDFAPYICLADVVGSELFGWGLARTETLAQGGSRCDFRFQRGAPTRVRVRLPVVREG